MAQRMNYDRLRHSGNVLEAAFKAPPKRWHDNQAAKAASPARSLSGTERAAAIVGIEERERDAKSKSRELITLTREPEVRDLDNGQRAIILRGVQEGRDKPIVAVMKASQAERIDEGLREDLDARLRRMGGGDKVSVAGTWARRRWSEDGVQRESWEFQAQRFRMGDVPLERIREREAEPARQAAMASFARGAGVAG